MVAQAPLLELLIRGAAIGVFVLLALRIVGDRTPARLTGALFCLGAAAHTITQSPVAFGLLGPGAVTVWALSVMAAGLFWAFAYNVAGITLAMAGVLNPILAAAAMVLSSLSVIGNSRRLRT